MKKRKKNMVAQIMAWLALFAIVIGIVGTGVLVLFSSGEQSGYQGEEAIQNLSQEDLQRIIDQSSTTIESEVVESVEVTSSGSIN